MTQAVRSGLGYQASSTSDEVTIPARPEALTVKPNETAIVVVDMQNAYATRGGYVDIAGFDTSGALGRHRANEEGPRGCSGLLESW